MPQYHKMPRSPGASPKKEKRKKDKDKSKERGRKSTEELCNYDLTQSTNASKSIENVDILRSVAAQAAAKRHANRGRSIYSDEFKFSQLTRSQPFLSRPTDVSE